MCRRTFCATLLLIIAGSSAPAAEGLIELTTGSQSWTGRQYAADPHKCWLADRDGRLLEVSLDKVTAFRQVEPAFKPAPMTEIRDRLRKEMGDNFQVVTRGNYIVAAPQGKAVIYAETLNRVHLDFTNYFRVRRFELPSLEFPLTAVIYPNREEFNKRCGTDGIAISKSLRGYYHPKSNQIVFFDAETEPDPQLAEVQRRLEATRAKYSGKNPTSLKVIRSKGAKSIADEARSTNHLNGLSRDTTVHEAIHQLAYNTGLHSRVGINPVWVVEGLAMQFEIGDIDLEGDVRRRSEEPLNLARLKNFAEYKKSRREPDALVKLISSKDLFGKNPVDAYSEAWMLTHYLIQTRPVKYSHFLMTLSVRGAVAEYPAEKRIEDFKTAFGEDLAWFEVEYLRHAEKLIESHLPEPVQ